MLLIDKLTNAIEKGEYGIGVFLDFSKAFDTVDHTILLSKLYHYGIRGSALSWFSSYLSNRKQYVSYKNVSSNIKTISCGVPQGSILGPVLFLLYMNDIANVCKYTMPFYLQMTQTCFLVVKIYLYSKIKPMRNYRIYRNG